MTKQIMDGRDAGAFIPSALDDFGLDPYAMRIYIRIVRRAGTRQGCFESIDNMALHCKMNRKTVYQSVKVLLRHHLIEKVSVPGKTSHYYLTPSSEWIPIPNQGHPTYTESGTPPIPDLGHHLSRIRDTTYTESGTLRVSNQGDQTKEKKESLPDAVSFFSESEPEAEQPSEPTENPPLLAEVEIKAEDKPTPNFQGQEKNQGVSVESENKAPQPPAYYIPSPEQGKKPTIKFPVPGDIDSAPYCQELCFLKFELPDELALGTKQIIQSKRRVFGRQLLCLMNDQGIDPIANLSKFLKFYFDKNLSNNTHYKGKEYDDLVQSQTAQAIANKIKDSDHAVLVQTIAEFKKKIAKAAQPTLQPRSLEPLPERGDCVLPDMSSVFEANKKRLEEQIKRNKEKRIKTAANSKKDISTISDPLLAAEAKLTQNPEIFTSGYDF